MGIIIATAASFVLAGVMEVPYVFDPMINVLSFLFSAGMAYCSDIFRPGGLRGWTRLRHFATSGANLRFLA